MPEIKVNILQACMVDAKPFAKTKFTKLNI